MQSPSPSPKDNLAASHLLRGTLNQYSGRIFFLPYDMMGVDLGIFLSMGLPMRRRRYSGGSSHERAGLGMSSATRARQCRPAHPHAPRPHPHPLSLRARAAPRRSAPPRPRVQRLHVARSPKRETDAHLHKDDVHGDHS